MLSGVMLSIANLDHYAERTYTEFVILNVLMLSALIASIVLLNVIMLSVLILCVVQLNVIMLKILYLVLSS
jgi:hypothetical protein